MKKMVAVQSQLRTAHEMLLNSRQKILVKWIMLSLSDSMPAPAMRFEPVVDNNSKIRYNKM